MNDEKVSIRIVEEGDAGYPDVVMRSVEHKEKYSLMQLTMGDKDVILVPLFQVLDQISEHKNKTGKWIKVDGNFLCSVCDSGYKCQPTCMGKPMFMFCPCCGVKMEGSEADAEKLQEHP